MRYVLWLLLVGGCFGSLDANGRPSVIPKLSALPAQPEQRDAVLDQSGNTAGPENGKGLTKKQRRAVTTTAFVAAIIGSIFSKSQNVMLGMGTTIDENRLSAKSRQRRADGGQDGAGSDSMPRPAVHDGEPVQLVPWVNLHH